MMYLYRNETDHLIWIDGRLILQGDSLWVDMAPPAPPEVDAPAVVESPPVQRPLYVSAHATSGHGKKQK